LDENKHFANSAYEMHERWNIKQIHTIFNATGQLRLIFMCTICKQEYVCVCMDDMQ
jgi:hypothetical protein